MRQKINSILIWWGVIMILELIYMGVGITNLIKEPLTSKGDWAAVLSACFVLLAGVISVRRELKKQKEK